MTHDACHVVCPFVVFLQQDDVVVSYQILVFFLLPQVLKQEEVAEIGFCTLKSVEPEFCVFGKFVKQDVGILAATCDREPAD